MACQVKCCFCVLHANKSCLFPINNTINSSKVKPFACVQLAHFNNVISELKLHYVTLSGSNLPIFLVDYNNLQDHYLIML